ncbi:uncharacterized protein CXorf49 homolog [Desmodus rotundus]|uniref:uncharacterized protein CXorf49 homolog n=1 Tax=Desmodus rotundus TaxID=9430 RepID=UPI0023810D21|nr:uncharacterized protein CXorf49 homolog [Desmodus rotundus]
MSAPDEDEGSVSGAGFDSESGQQRAGTLGFALGSPQSREGEGQGEGGSPDPEGFVGHQHVMEAARQVPQGWEGRTGSLANFEGATPASFGNRAAMVIPQQLTNRDAWGFRRSPFPESSDRQVSTVWLDPEPGSSGRDTRALGWVGSQMAPGVSFHFRGPEGDLTWGSPEKGVSYRSKASVGHQRAFEEGPASLPWSDSESLDEFSEIQLMRVSICQKGGSQAKPTIPNDTRSPWRTPVREKFRPVPGPCLSFAPRTLPSGEEGQAVGDPEVSSEKPHSVTWGKAGSRLSYLPLVVAAGALPKATPRRKAAQEMTSLEGASKVVRECFFHFRGQRGSGAPQDPATFSPISGVPLFGTGTSHALTPFGTKESKPTGTGQKSVAQRNSGSELVVGVGEDKEPSRDPFPEGEVTWNLLRNSQHQKGCSSHSNNNHLEQRVVLR